MQPSRDALLRMLRERDRAEIRQLEELAERLQTECDVADDLYKSLREQVDNARALRYFLETEKRRIDRMIADVRSDLHVLEQINEDQFLIRISQEMEATGNALRLFRRR